MKNFTYAIIFSLFMFSAVTADEAISNEVPSTEEALSLQEMDQSISKMKKWQRKYISQKKRYLSQAKHLLFQEPSVKEIKHFEALAEDADLNALALQDQIESLQQRRAALADPK